MELESIRQPSDLRSLSEAELRELSGEIRDFTVWNVALTPADLASLWDTAPVKAP